MFFFIYIIKISWCGEKRLVSLHETAGNIFIVIVSLTFTFQALLFLHFPLSYPLLKLFSWLSLIFTLSKINVLPVCLRIVFSQFRSVHPPWLPQVRESMFLFRHVARDILFTDSSPVVLEVYCLLVSLCYGLPRGRGRLDMRRTSFAASRWSCRSERISIESKWWIHLLLLGRSVSKWGTLSVDGIFDQLYREYIIEVSGFGRAAYQGIQFPLPGFKRPWTPHLNGLIKTFLKE